DQSLWHEAEALQIEGGLTALPYSRKLFALYYNKDVFDEHDTPYPRDGMTWDEVLDLAARLPSGFNLDVSYMGWINMAYQLSLPFTVRVADPLELEKRWMEIVRLHQAISELPGNRIWENLV